MIIATKQIRDTRDLLVLKLSVLAFLTQSKFNVVSLLLVQRKNIANSFDLLPGMSVQLRQDNSLCL